MSDWISIKDRLPEKGIPILVYWDCIVSMGIHMNGGFVVLEDFMYRAHGVGYDLVTHWMPLPKSPEINDNRLSEKNIISY